MRRGREPVPIAKLVRDLLIRRGVGGSIPFQAVTEAFLQVADERLVKRVRVVALKGGEVTFETDSAALAYELKSFAGKKLLADLKRQKGAEFVTSLRFRSGAVTDGSG
jgi:hypothetical protein